MAMPHLCRIQRSQVWLACAVVAAASASTGQSASAAGYRVIHSFCSKTGCPDGAAPTGGVLAGDTGNIFGATEFGGKSGLGMAFEFAAGTKKFSESRLHSFCASGCRDGRSPSFPLIRDTAGNLYGTTASGGSAGGGVVFELLPGTPSWKLKVLHTFCSPNGGTCKEGASPSGGLTYEGAAAGVTYDGQSPLFGTTAAGGALGGGTLFELAIQDGNWQAKPLHAFCPPPSCESGAAPGGGLVLDPAGNIFGVTALGGADDGGTAFELSPAGSKYDYTVIHDFCSQQDCVDGIQPIGGLALDASNNLYGTTHRDGNNDAGTLFELSPANGQFDFQILHQFCETTCPDGASPVAPLTIDAKGNIFGTTTQFGQLGYGTLFEMSPSQSGFTYTVLYDFCSETSCADGSVPESPLAVDQAGNLWGTTETGGSANLGVIFEFAPG